LADTDTSTSAEPQDLVSIVRSADAPRDLRLFAARGMLPLERDDWMRALLAVLGDPDPEVAGSAVQTFTHLPPDDLVRFLESGRPTTEEIEALSLHSDDAFVLERVIRHRGTGDATLLRLAATVTGAPQDALVVNQVRLLRQPALIEALLANPSLVDDGRRRLRELNEEFFEKVERRREQERLRLEEEERRAREEAEGIVFSEAADAAETAGELDLGEGAAEAEEFNSASLAQVYRRIAAMTVKEKVDLAQKGSKEERRILIGDINKLVSLAVLKCESLAQAEIETFCGMRHLHSEVFREIATTREWIKKPRIQIALVNNPAVPLNVTLPLIKFLGMRDLRNITRDRNLPEAVRTAARKILFEKRG
jgi:hypothetical protein